MMTFLLKNVVNVVFLLEVCSLVACYLNSAVFTSYIQLIQAGDRIHLKTPNNCTETV